MDLKDRYIDGLRKVLQTPRGRKKPRSIQRIIDYTEAQPVLTHRPSGHRTWVWSDLHLRHANIIKYCERLFRTAPEMDRALMTAWRYVVGPDDTVLNGATSRWPGASENAAEHGSGRPRAPSCSWSGTTTSAGGAGSWTPPDTTSRRGSSPTPTRRWC